MREKIAEDVEGLKSDPDLQGKALHGDLADFRSLRSVGQRYRIIYRIIKKQVVVIVVAVGMRKQGDRRDIYKTAQRLIRLGLLESPK
ncbi:MAG: type II toxin-antitoxin system RelE family toxin [Acidobacteriota bacterium]